jgi:Dehydrogenases with different specificities (related to short-chain alcohol dehydrogenases)
VVGFGDKSVYAAAKAGVHHLTRVLALEWAPHQINVNAVAPCITQTPSRRNILDRPGYKEWATGKMLPIGRWNQPEDLVGAVLFLSSHLSDMVVGHVLMVDGGWTLH